MNAKAAKQQVLLWFLGVGGIVLAGFSAFNFMHGLYSLALVELCILAYIPFCWIQVRQHQAYDQATHFVIFSNMILALMLFQNGGVDQTGIYWLIVFPLIVFFLVEVKTGRNWMFVFLTLLSGILLLYTFALIDLPYTVFQITCACIVCLCFALLAYLNQYFLECAAINLQQSVDKAEQASHAKGEFLAMMSHELRTPLHGIIGLQDMLRHELKGLSSIQQEHLDMAQYSARALSTLIDDILDLVKIESGDLSLKNTAFDLAPLLKQSLLTFMLTTKQKGIELELNIVDAPCQIYADEARIRQVLLNLIGNAVKFTEHGKIALHAGWSGSMLCLEIHDTGIGISEADQQRLFEPFQQCSNSADRQGAGLGATIAMRFTKMMNGSISIQSEEGKGSIFRVQLAAEAVADERISSQQVISQPEPDANRAVDHLNLSGLKLLLAEDDPIARFLALDSLQAAGLQVTAAENGLIAWKMLQADNFDLLLTDIRMPGIDGIELTRKVREMEQGTEKHMRIIGLSAHAMTHVAEEAYAAGMDDFIAKPIEPEELMRRLRPNFPT